jgi:membrane-associated protease RseP (regulator of RpoE activity)
MRTVRKLIPLVVTLSVIGTGVVLRPAFTRDVEDATVIPLSDRRFSSGLTREQQEALKNIPTPKERRQLEVKFKKQNHAKVALAVARELSPAQKTQLNDITDPQARRQKELELQKRNEAEFVVILTEDEDATEAGTDAMTGLSYQQRDLLKNIENPKTRRQLALMFQKRNDAESAAPNGFHPRTVLTTGASAKPAGAASPMVNEGRIGRGSLGVSVSSVEDRAGALALDPNVNGVLIEDIDPFGPGAKAGLQPGDVVVAFNNQPVTRVEQLQRMVGAAPANGTVQLRVRRGNQTLALPAKLEDREDSALSDPTITQLDKRPTFKVLPEPATRSLVTDIEVPPGAFRVDETTHLSTPSQLLGTVAQKHHYKANLPETLVWAGEWYQKLGFEVFRKQVAYQLTKKGFSEISEDPVGSYKNPDGTKTIDRMLSATKDGTVLLGFWRIHDEALTLTWRQLVPPANSTMAAGGQPGASQSNAGNTASSASTPPGRGMSTSTLLNNAMALYRYKQSGATGGMIWRKP